MKIITKTGSEYVIEDGMFIKNGFQWHTISDMFFFDIKDLDPTVKGWVDFWKFSKTMNKSSEPEVGKHMYIEGRDVWWITTEIVGVEIQKEEQ